MPDPSYPEWRGWHRPRYTPVPDQLFDEWLAPGRLSSVELRVLLYILRHTFGWHKDVDRISLTQITDGILRRDGTRQDWGAGVSRQSAITAIKGLEDKRLIVTHKQKSADRGFETNSYGLLMAPEGWSNNLTSPVQSLDSTLVQPLDSQETPNPTNNKNGSTVDPELLNAIRTWAYQHRARATEPQVAALAAAAGTLARWQMVSVGAGSLGAVERALGEA
jgi:hypothetical protein